MKATIKHLFIALFVFAAYASKAQSTPVNHSSQTANTKAMKTYLIQREVPGAEKLTPEQLKAMSQKSNAVLSEMHGIEWLQSYVVANKIVCVYKAENEDLIREHAKKAGFPANSITEIGTTISPATGTRP